MTLERDFSSRAKQEYVAVGAIIFVCTGSLWQGSGWPDWWVGHPEFTGWLELKVNKHKCERLQRIKLREMRKRRVPAFVYRLTSDGTEQLELEDETLVGEVAGTAMQKLRQMRLYSEQYLG